MSKRIAIILITVITIVIILAILLFYHFRKHVTRTLSQPQVNELYRIMSQADKILSTNNVPYFISCGTLLGAIRDKGLIPWDNDIDIGIEQKDLDKLVSLKPLFEQVGMSVNFNDKIWRLASRSIDNIYIDVFPYVPQQGQQFLHHADPYNRSRFSKEWLRPDELFPIQRIYQFGPFLLPGPHKGQDFLARMYGPSWHIPKSRGGIFGVTMKVKSPALPQ